MDHVEQLLASYPAAVTDFYGSGSFCIYKTGPEWPVGPPGGYAKVRAPRPYYNPTKAGSWHKTLHSICNFLDSRDVKLTTVDPLAYANAGEAEVFCALVVVVSVEPHSLAYGDAVTAASGVVTILEDAGFSGAQAAFIEAVYRHLGKLMSFDPSAELDEIAKVRKPFSPSLAVSIAPLASPEYEGTGGLFLRLSSDPTDKRVFLLTCAHVAHPPPLHKNEPYTHAPASHRREKVALLGPQSFGQSVAAITEQMTFARDTVTAWESTLSRIPEQMDDEPSSRTELRNELVGDIKRKKRVITIGDKLRSTVIKDYASIDSRVLGHVYHCAKIEHGEDGYISDWALIELDADKLDAANFVGNRLYVGGSERPGDWRKYLYPQPHDSADFFIPPADLLQLQDYVREEEFRNPQQYDNYDKATLLAVKNGRTTGTTFGRVNGLESITRDYVDPNLKVDALQVLVLDYDTSAYNSRRFSYQGDSGAMVVDRRGRLIGLITGGASSTRGPDTDRTYVTPYHKLKRKIEEEFPDTQLLPRDFNFLFAK